MNNNNSLPDGQSKLKPNGARLHRKYLTRTLLVSALAASSSFANAFDCSTLLEWQSSDTYLAGDQVKSNNVAYEAKWWTQNQAPANNSGQWQVWLNRGACDGDVNLPPTVSISSPTGTVELPVGNNLSVTVGASDSDGSVTQVELLVNGSSVATDTLSPFEFQWQVTASQTLLSARATDDKGAQTVSSSVQVTGTTTSNEPPTVNITQPAGGSQFNENDAVTIEAAAADADGSVTSVAFYRGNTLLGEDTSAPYQWQWQATVGNHQLTAVARDNEDATTTSAAVSISVTGNSVGTQCKPEGLYSTPGTNSPYCSIYDDNGREKMANNRRVIGYFTSWRNGANGQPSYLVNNIPWDKVTHINYAFAHVNGQNQISVGNAPQNPATNMEWPGVTGAEMDPDFNFKGHFNLLNKYKKQYPQVKTLISVGGWAESGGYFDDNGNRVNSGGFYTMTTNSDGSINHAGIETFANSAVEFIRTYGFDGVDIDYEYPTTMNDAGNPLDFEIANNLRPGLVASYVELMKVLRAKLDVASEADGTHYMLTIAAPSSGYLLRGIENFPVTQYLDYVNIMSYDLHGAWNEFVGHNASLYDTGEDAELAAAGIYNLAAYGGIGYLNTDWAVHYFRGAMSAGRINIGVPYYTRGWKGVTGGQNGLNGRAPLPSQSECPDGTGGAAKCGYGAIGIDNLWHDKDEQGNEMGAGSNPMWHAKNLQQGIPGSYLEVYGLDPANNPDHQLTGQYSRHYDSVAVAPWLWNSSKQVFLSIEDEQSMGTKLDYIVDQDLGGVMFWELAGDYDWDSQKQEYFMGETLTSLAASKFSQAGPYGNQLSDQPTPTEAVDIEVEIYGFKLGDQNYPITPKLKFTNRTGVTLPGGTEFQFSVPTSAPDGISDQSGGGLTVIQSGANAAGNNIGGLENDFHRVSFTLPSWKSLADGDFYELQIKYYLPISGPSQYALKIGGKSYGFHFEYPDLPVVQPAGGSGGNGDSCADQGVDPSALSTYPEWPRDNHAAGGDLIIHNGMVYRAKWWTNSVPGGDSSWESVCVI